MDLQYIRRVVKIVTDSGIQELEIEEEGRLIRVTRSLQNNQQTVMSVPAMPPPSAPAPVPTAMVPAAEKVADDSKYHKVLSPIVGTYYKAPAPDAEDYVKVGSSVSQGSALCIIEAMKIMNEIECDVSGKIVKILVENGQPVEYNQPLFLIDLS